MSKVITDEKKIEQVLSRGVEHVYPDKATLKKLLMSGKKITLYCGYDPTAPTLHIGHGITIRKLAKFQELGHQVIFLFGDFTGQIGDPSGKSSTRKVLTHADVMANLKGWKEQIKNIIDVDKIEFKFNSEWLAKLTFKEVIELSHYFTVQQMLERDMFEDRMKNGQPIYLHEFFYPLMQAYDSVAMDVDLEIGGNDQTFNMLAGRDLIRSIKNKDKCVLTTKLLSDPTGKKMGKSEGNMITLDDAPEDMYGKVMSWPDEMILPAFEILTDVPEDMLSEAMKKIKEGVNPRDYKMQLAFEVVNIYLGAVAAEAAQENFKRVFQDKQKPLEIKEVKIKDKDGKLGVLDLFVSSGLAKSNSEVRRLIQEKAIRINDELVIDENIILDLPTDGLLLQRGKKLFARVFKA